MSIYDIDYRTILYSPLFSRMIATIIIIVIGLIIGRIIGKIIYRVLHELEVNKAIRKTTKIKVSLEKFISNFIMYFIYFITLIMAMTQIGLTTTVLNIIIGAIAVVLIIALFFIIKDFFPNIIAGIFIQQKKYIKEGEFIEIDNKKGKVTNINLIETTIKTNKGDIVYIPNSFLLKKEITKLARSK